MTGTGNVVSENGAFATALSATVTWVATGIEIENETGKHSATPNGTAKRGPEIVPDGGPPRKVSYVAGASVSA